MHTPTSDHHFKAKTVRIIIEILRYVCNTKKICNANVVINIMYALYMYVCMYVYDMTFYHTLTYISPDMLLATGPIYHSTRPDMA